MRFENAPQLPRITEAERTPHGLEVTVNDNGKIYTVRTSAPGKKLTIVRGMQGLPDTVSKPAFDLIQEALASLVEKA